MAEQVVSWFETDEVEELPAVPGLYGWYAVPVAGPPDWQIDFDDNGLDLGAKNFGAFLAQHTSRLRSPALQVQVKGHFWWSWVGQLSESGMEALSRHLDQLGAQSTHPGSGTKLRWALNNADARELLASILVDASPRLSAPIYLGVAVNLRDRLGQHVEALNEARTRLALGEPLTEKLRGSFGGRAAIAGIGVDHLRIATLPMPEIDRLTTQDLRHVAEAAEFVLNRWHHPLFGER